MGNGRKRLKIKIFNCEICVCGSLTNGERQDIIAARKQRRFVEKYDIKERHGGQSGNGQKRRQQIA